MASREATSCNNKARGVRLNLGNGRPEYIGYLQKMLPDGIKWDGMRRHAQEKDSMVWRRGQVFVAAEAGAFAGLFVGVAGIVTRGRNDLQAQEQQSQSGQAGEKATDLWAYHHVDHTGRKNDNSMPSDGRDVNRGTACPNAVIWVCCFLA